MSLPSGAGRVVCGSLELTKMQTRPPNTPPGHGAALNLGNERWRSEIRNGSLFWVRPSQRITVAHNATVGHVWSVVLMQLGARLTCMACVTT